MNIWTIAVGEAIDRHGTTYTNLHLREEKSDGTARTFDLPMDEDVTEVVTEAVYGAWGKALNAAVRGDDYDRVHVMRYPAGR